MQTNRSMPASEVIPEIPYPDVPQAAEWLCQAFGFSERLRVGTHRSQLTFGSGSVIVTAHHNGPIACQTTMVRVGDVDGHFARASRQGARILSPPADYPYGERQYTAADLAGHRWVFSQTIRDTHPREWGGTLLAQSAAGHPPVAGSTRAQRRPGPGANDEGEAA